MLLLEAEEGAPRSAPSPQPLPPPPTRGGALRWEDCGLESDAPALRLLEYSHTPDPTPADEPSSIAKRVRRGRVSLAARGTPLLRPSPRATPAPSNATNADAVLELRSECDKGAERGRLHRAKACRRERVDGVLQQLVPSVRNGAPRARRVPDCAWQLVRLRRQPLPEPLGASAVSRTRGVLRRGWRVDRLRHRRVRDGMRYGACGLEVVRVALATDVHVRTYVRTYAHASLACCWLGG